VLQFYKTKQVRILAAVSPTRHPAFPDVPTITEAGFPIDNPIFDWRGLGAPKGTPPEILKVMRGGPGAPASFVSTREFQDVARSLPGERDWHRERPVSGRWRDAGHGGAVVGRERARARVGRRAGADGRRAGGVACLSPTPAWTSSQMNKPPCL